MNIDDRIAKAKALIAERERIDRELSLLFGGPDLPRRGRPRKYAEGNSDQAGEPDIPG
jgi:hypothetical protein